MPGIFGAVGAAPGERARLRRFFTDIWTDAAVAEEGPAMVGGHAFGDHVAVRQDVTGALAALDGEAAVYTLEPHTLATAIRAALEPSSTDTSDVFQACGNIAVFDVPSSQLSIFVEPTGTFPLYYHFDGHRLLFSSLLRPLALTVGSQPDVVAAMTFVEKGYICAARTHFLGINRLLAGQLLRFNCLKGTLEIADRDRFWSTDTMPAPAGTNGVAASFLDAFQRYVHRAFPGSQRHALMLSGGWDSRILLAVLCAHLPRSALSAYVYGDLESREVRIVELLSRSVDLPLHEEPLSNQLYALDFLKAQFQRTENLVFPHWHRAGAVLEASGAQTVTSGVYGEILGGHYGPAMALTGVRSGAALGFSLISKYYRLSEVVLTRLARSARDGLLREEPRRPWYVKETFWQGERALPERIRGDVAESIDRLTRMGVRDESQLVEAFITTHRGAQYVAAQPLSCRAHIDIALPFADRSILALATRIPIHRRIHNLVSQQILESLAPALLRLPTGAILVNASAPVALQETSRALRKLYDASHYSVGRRLGRSPLSRLGWVNFEFLRDGKALNDIIDDLCLDFWDLEALRRRVRDAADRKGPIRSHPLSDQLMKIYTTDLTLRRPDSPAAHQ